MFSRRGALLSFLALSVLYTLLPNLLMHTGDTNLYVHQARSFLEGRVDLPSERPETAVADGRFFVPFPPFPALLLVPCVALMGVEATRTLLFGLALTAVGWLALTRILKAMEVEEEFHLPLQLAFFLGSGYWFALIYSSSVHCFAHVVAVTCLLLAIGEALGPSRGWLCGLFLGVAFLSRQVTLYAGLFLLASLWEKPSSDRGGSRWIRVAGFGASALACLVAYLAFNAARFGDPLDSGYSRIRLSGFLGERMAAHGLFHPAYFPFNFSYMFLQGFHLAWTPSASLREIGMDPFGTSLIFSSPFLLAAFFARSRGRLVCAGWLSVGLALVHMLFYYNNGWYQVNTQRFTLDFLPVLMVMAARGTRSLPVRLWKGAVVYSIGLNWLALTGVPTVQRLARWL